MSQARKSRHLSAGAGRFSLGAAQGAVLRVVLPYAALGAVWILFSDRALLLFTGNSSLMLAVSTAKGWLYVLITSVLLWILVARELSRRSALERRLTAEIEEKAILLAEIHHRVKNNLQIISSILNLERDGAMSAEAREICRTTALRVGSMALVHEELYAERDFAHIDLGEYLRNLAANIGDAFGLGVGSFDFELEKATVTPEVALPFGLLVSEAITNAIKHGRPDGEKDPSGPAEIRVSVALRHKGEHALSLRIKDSGPGFPGLEEAGAGSRKAGLERQGLGLVLMNSLAAQLGGTLCLSSEGGGVVTLDFAPSPRS